MNTFKEIQTSEFPLNPFELKTKWMLITAVKNGKVNTMVASWGGFGIMWNKNAVFVLIRPHRYTKEFVDAAESFSLSFFDKSYQSKLSYLGKTSGRDEDKIKKAEMTIAYDNSIPYFEEAELVIEVKKLYAQPMQEDCYIQAEDIIEKCYPNRDFHQLYIAEISKILVKE